MAEIPCVNGRRLSDKDCDGCANRFGGFDVRCGTTLSMYGGETIVVEDGPLRPRGVIGCRLSPPPLIEPLFTSGGYRP